MKMTVLNAVLPKNDSNNILVPPCLRLWHGALAPRRFYETSVRCSSGTKPLRAVLSVMQRASMKCSR